MAAIPGGGIVCASAARRAMTETLARSNLRMASSRELGVIDYRGYGAYGRSEAKAIAAIRLSNGETLVIGRRGRRGHIQRRGDCGGASVAWGCGLGPGGDRECAIRPGVGHMPSANVDGHRNRLRDRRHELLGSRRPNGHYSRPVAEDLVRWPRD